MENWKSLAFDFLIHSNMNQFRTNKLKQPIWPNADTSIIIYVIDSLLPKINNKLVIMAHNAFIHSILA